MLQYIVRRIFLSIPVLFGILLVTFAMARLIPGDPCRAILGEKATKAVCDQFIREKGLDKPLHIQFGIYVSEMVRGDFGRSFRFGMPVTRLLVERLPMTIELSISAMLVSILVGIPLGIISAVRHNSWVDVVTMIWANIGVSMPVFWLGLMLAYIFALALKDTPFQLPPSGRLSPGLITIPFFEIWGLELTEGTFFYNISDFFSRMNLFNSVLSANWEVFKDAI